MAGVSSESYTNQNLKSIFNYQVNRLFTFNFQKNKNEQGFEEKPLRSKIDTENRKRAS